MKETIGMALIAAALAAFLGWCMNLFAVVSFVLGDPASIGGLMIGRIAGIFFAPLGAILGYF